MSDGWGRYRRLPVWVQVVGWVLLWPVPLFLWAASRPRAMRTGPLLLAAASTVAWVSIPISEATTGRASKQQAGHVASQTTTTTSSAPTTTTTTAETTTTTAVATTRSTSTVAETTSTTSTTVPAETTTTTASSSDRLLAGLRVAPEGPRTGYDRDLFPHWVDADGDRCNTREEVLIAQSRTPAQVDPYGCKVLAGDWHSPYDNATTSDPADLEIDHVVALAEAWDSGASEWTTDRRRAFANDLDEPAALIAVTSTSNRSKSDSDPTQWQPRPDDWCRYATAWATVKTRWDLTADQPEVDTLREMLDTC